MAFHAAINLTFHGLGTPSPSVVAEERPYWLSRPAFEDVLDRVATRHHVRLFFDDGNASDVDIALPALSARGLTASFYVVAGRIGKPGFLSRDGLEEILASDMPVGSHGWHHQPWRGLAPAELDKEIRGSRECLEQIIQRPVTAAACPFGAYDRRALACLRSAGYRRVYTSDQGPTRAGTWLQPRTSLHQVAQEDPLSQVDLDPSAPGTLIHEAKLFLKRWR
jgi:peptidoglycan/xylan/chitin deacetylase (PgdA/CDA1 family)